MVDDRLRKNLQLYKCSHAAVRSARRNSELSGLSQMSFSGHCRNMTIYQAGVTWALGVITQASCEAIGRL